MAQGENTTGKAKPTISKMTFKVLQPMLCWGVRHHMNQALTTEPYSVGNWGHKIKDTGTSTEALECRRIRGVILGELPPFPSQPPPLHRMGA